MDKGTGIKCKSVSDLSYQFIIRKKPVSLVKATMAASCKLILNNSQQCSRGMSV